MSDRLYFYRRRLTLDPQSANHGFAGQGRPQHNVVALRAAAEGGYPVSFDAGCLLLLVDQSSAMDVPTEGCAEAPQFTVAAAINRWLYDAVVRASRGPGRYASYDFGVIGFRTGDSSADADGMVDYVVGPIWGGALAQRELVPAGEVAANPARIVKVPVMSADPDTGIRTEHTVSIPEWVAPMASGQPALCTALYQAFGLVEGWIRGMKDAVPPMVVTFFAGDAFDSDPTPYALPLHGLQTSRGTVQSVIVHYSPSARVPVLFPASPSEVPDGAPALLFQCATPLSAEMQASAASRGEEVRPGARAMALNPTPELLDAFLSVILAQTVGSSGISAAGVQTVSKFIGNTSVSRQYAASMKG